MVAVPWDAPAVTRPVEGSTEITEGAEKERGKKNEKRERKFHGLRRSKRAKSKGKTLTTTMKKKTLSSTKPPQNGGQRVATMLMYLTTPEEGGETVFPSAPRKVSGPQWSECAREGFAVKPRRGDALLFYSLRPNGRKDEDSLHGSCPVLKGEKWSSTKWIHVVPFGTPGSEAVKVKWHPKSSSPKSSSSSSSDGAKGAGAACRDLQADCSGWAQRGECAKNPKYMLDSCKKSCGACGGGGAAAAASKTKTTTKAAVTAANADDADDVDDSLKRLRAAAALTSQAKATAAMREAAFR